MAVYRYEVEIGDDHQVTLPKEVPVGRAEIVVTPQAKANSDWERTKQVIQEMATGPFHITPAPRKRSTLTFVVSERVGSNTTSCLSR